MLEHIRDLKYPPIVGDVYLVDCVQAIPGWIPLLGDAHQDAEIGLGTVLHQHIDVRFLADEQLRQNLKGQSAQQSMDSILDHDFIRGRAIETRPLICWREMPIFPLNDRTFSVLEPLERIYRDWTVDDCLECPHKRFNLADVPVVSGARVCPGHGLKWRVSDGRLIFRTKQKKKTSSRGRGFS